MARYTVNRSTSTTTNLNTGETKTVVTSGSSSHRSYNTGTITRLLGAVCLIVLLLNLFFAVRGNPDNKFTFERLLNVLADVPDLHIEDWKIPLFTGDWDIHIGSWSIGFNWLKDFLNNYWLTPVNTILFLIGGIFTIVTFVAYFVSFLFGA